LPGGAFHVTSDDANRAREKSFGAFAGNAGRGYRARAQGGVETIESRGAENWPVQYAGERNREGLADGTSREVEGRVAGEIFEAENGVAGRGNGCGLVTAGDEEEGKSKNKSAGDKITSGTYSLVVCGKGRARGHGVPASSGP
jgi:hypothetical protein